MYFLGGQNCLFGYFGYQSEGYLLETSFSLLGRSKKDVVFWQVKSFVLKSEIDQKTNFAKLPSAKCLFFCKTVNLIIASYLLINLKDLS